MRVESFLRENFCKYKFFTNSEIMIDVRSGMSPLDKVCDQMHVKSQKTKRVQLFSLI